MKVWYFEWGNDSYVCHDETLISASQRVAEDIVSNRRANHYGNDFRQVAAALESEGTEIKEFQTLFFKGFNWHCQNCNDFPPISPPSIPK